MSRVIASLRSHAEDCPDGIAIYADYSTLTWSELWYEVQALADHFRMENAVGLYMENSLQWIVADLAALYAETTCVPIPVFFSTEQVAHALDDADVSLVIGDVSLDSGCLAEFRKRQTVQVSEVTLQLWENSQKNTGARPTWSKITYTSGTTGNPKGVALSLSQIETVIASLAEIAEGCDTDRSLVLLPLSTLLENIGSVYVPLMVKASILVPDARSLGFHGSSHVDALQLGKALQEWRPTTAILVPQLLKLFIALGSKGVLADSFRFIAVGGAPVSATLLKQAADLGLPVVQGYGMSEAASVVAMNSLRQNRPGSVGKPLPHIELSIAVDGEILLAGIEFEGYVHSQDEKSDEKYATGDLGYLDEDGFLYVTGRKRDVIITSFGRNVSPEWIESELLADAAVSQSLVFGNDQTSLSAVIVPASGVSVADIHKAVQHLNIRLPDYARIQNLILANKPFSFDNGLLTANGRPRRQQIEARYLSASQNTEEKINEHFF